MYHFLNEVLEKRQLFAQFVISLHFSIFKYTILFDDVENMNINVALPLQFPNVFLQ